jgi:hypothetical protein
VESEFVGENNVAFPFDTFGSDFRMRWFLFKISKF